MGYKKMNWNMTFAEIDLMTSMEHNRSLKMMEKINNIIDWSEIEAVLLKHYTVGTTIEGADAYPISNKEIQEQREKRETPEGRMDKHGNTLKFSRGFESDWVTKNEIHHSD